MKPTILPTLDKREHHAKLAEFDTAWNKSTTVFLVKSIPYPTREAMTP